MRSSISKYFWDLNKRALKETIDILRNPGHPKFVSRLVTLLSRCDKPRELFSFISKKRFIESWPKIQRYWTKVQQESEFRDWWKTIYEQLLQKYSKKEKTPKGRPLELSLKTGGIIRDARIRMGLSQMELASKVGMKQPDISRIEEGEKNITLKTLAALCKVLGIKRINF